ncbi:sensor histidine kinase [Streptomyces monticola]|uniref:histidine kinase n=1 Tax=Streptomyces monticola TaxID=2666263 RepID=A0ABW2JV84_9ACTN
MRVRTRIALVFGALFLTLGAVLLTVVNIMARRGTKHRAQDIAREQDGAGGDVSVVPDPSATPPLGSSVSVVTLEVSQAASQELMLWSAVGLGVTVILAVAVGWWTAGRVLRPVHAMTARARQISARNLHERIAAQEPDDELKELGDTLDGLLERLDQAFESQRRFVANASHELRTPLATQRTAIQVGLADPAPSSQDLARTKELLLASNRRSEHLIEGLLTLAHSERGLDEREPVDLAEVVREECAAHGETPGIRLEVTTSPCWVLGNRTLLSRLAANLVANAFAYNREQDGTVRVVVTRKAELTVANTGPQIPASAIPALFEPFRRGEGRDRTGTGSGLGLSIVASIVAAHGGRVHASPGPPGHGGLIIRVTLEPAGDTPGRTPSRHS